MFAVFKGADCSPPLGLGPTPYPDAQDAASGFGRRLPAKEEEEEESGSARGEGDLQRFSLRGAAFGHWLSAPDASWAYITDPETGLKVHLALCGEIENESEIAELYSVRGEAMEQGGSGGGGQGAPNLCTYTSSSAKLLLDLYWKGFSDAYGDYSAQPETCLASLEGSWSFCVFDESSGYILVASSREPSPATTFYWATCPTTGDVSVTTESLRDLLDRSTLAEFPRGHFYIKSLCNPDGELASFSPKPHWVVDMESEQSAWCGQVFRVASGSDIAGLHAGTDVQAQ